VAQLVLLKGAPGLGKSTLARRFAQERALTLVLDVDQVRGMLGCCLDQPTGAGLLARRLAIARARAHLQVGHDVIAPRNLGRLEFVEMLEAVAVQVGGTYFEFALISDRNDVVRRFERRSEVSTDPIHRDAAELQRRSGGRQQLAAAQEKVLAVVAARPATRVITSIDGDVPMPTSSSV
jgi:predicted kinase